VGALDHLIDLVDPADCYLGVDCEPEDEAVVLRWLAGASARRRRASPARISAAQPRSGSKRCRNARLVASGYAFRYPSYRDGYAAVLAEER
jgi:hypothetical protein